jgi:RNA polymerase sigma factor (sigma-70 family)
MKQTLLKTVIDFFSTERKKMINFVRKRLNDESYRDAEDIVQDVMVRIFDSADLNIPIEKLSAYVYTAIRNKIIDTMRSRRNQLSLDEISEQEELSLVSVMNHVKQADKVLEDEQYNQTVYDAIGRLSEEERAIVIATEFEDVTFTELSEMWDVPIGTLLSKKSRALGKIKKMLTEGGIKNEHE